MKTNLNSISQEEKDRILEMHIKAILNEQGTQLNISSNFQQGKAKTQQSGQQSGQAFKNIIASGLKTAKEVLVTIGKTIIKFVIFGGAVVVVIGQSLFKIGQAIFNAIVKFLTSIGKVVVSGAKAVGNATIDVFTKMAQKTGQAIKSGVNFITTQVKNLADSTYKIIVYILKSLKQLGILFWGKVLVMAATIKEFGQNVWNWCKQQYMSVAKQLGVAWDKAVDLAKQGWESLKNFGQKAWQGVKDVGNAALDYGKQAANKVADYAGQAYGAVSGFAQGLFNESVEFYSIYNSLSSRDTFTLINECSLITKSVIL